MDYGRSKIKALFISLCLLLPFLLAIPHCTANPEHLKIDHIALLNPVSDRKSRPEPVVFLNKHFQKYANARPQVTLIPFQYNEQPPALQELRAQGYQLAVIPTIKHGLFGEDHSLTVYELNQNRKLWTLSKTLESDTEHLFWILDRSLTAGIKLAPKSKITLGLVPGKQDDFSVRFPCNIPYYTIQQLPNLEIKNISFETFKPSVPKVQKLAAESRLDYILFYQATNSSSPIHS